MKDLLEVLRVQRHDFMNHLQVISGLLQLKRYDRAYEYIGQVAEELGQAGMLARLEVPEITAAVLVSGLRAAERGIVLHHEVSTGMEKGIHNGPAAAEIVGGMLETAIHSAETSPCLAGKINLEIREQDGEYIFRTSYRCREDSAIRGTGAASLEEAAKRINGRLAVAHSADGIIAVTLSLPVAAGE
ncbi:MAG: hypothetical protein CVU89_02505 [Firmicutes bacterium HGW-Firmicutes-14]|jgi:sensor histidine kinase regulating citrate/malate metabolism|nr:MAG: hypothetical protein CVU89_02505 [Firmicutes bacterium HGW-Firmicutes-14]